MFPSLKCFHCPESDCITLDLSDLPTFRCRECEAEFSIEDVQAHLAQWQAVVAWIGQEAPVEA